MMQNKNINNKLDPFSDLIRKKMDNYHLQPDDSLWDRIEKDLPQAPRRSLRPFFWWGGVAVAASLLLFIFIPFLNKKPVTDRMVEYADVVSVEQKKAIDLEELEQHVKVSPEKRDNVVRPDDKLSAKQQSTSPAIVKNQKLDQEEEVLTLEEDTNETANDQHVAEPAGVENSQALHGANNVQQGMNPLEQILLEKNQLSVTSSKQTRRFLLTASAGSGAAKTGRGLDFSSPVASSGVMLSGDKPEKYNIMTAARVPAPAAVHTTHLPPLTFSIAFTMPLSDSWAIESGLSYTHLKSLHSRGKNKSDSGTSHLHYLGLPLNVMYNVFTYQNWRVYLSGGGMVEYAVSAYYKQTDSPVLKHDVRSLQWSTGASVGADYKIMSQVRLFLEPRISYFFDNNQPESSRTENPLNVGVNGGVRFEF